MAKKLPNTVRQQVLMEAGYRCAVPTCRNILALDLHHIVHVSEDGGDDPANLLALCGFCHDLYHRGEITKDAIRIYKGILAALNYAFDRETIDNLLFLQILHTTPKKPLLISGDGVLKFSRLIAAGLADFSRVVWDIDTIEELWDLSQSSAALYQVRLTQKGQMLVDAWLKGDRIAVENALAQS